MNPRYIFAVSRHSLIHGGLGHQPLPSEEFLLCFIIISLGSFSTMENFLNLGIFSSVQELLQIELVIPSPI